MCRVVTRWLGLLSVCPWVTQGRQSGSGWCIHLSRLEVSSRWFEQSRLFALLEILPGIIPRGSGA